MSTKNFARFCFSANHELLILRDVLRVNPYEHAYKWHEIYRTFIKSNCLNNDYRRLCTARSVKEHVNRLVKLFIKGQWDTLRKSGNEMEVAEKIRMLRSIRKLIKNTKEKKLKLIKKARSKEHTETDKVQYKSSGDTLDKEESNNSLTSARIKIEKVYAMHDIESLTLRQYSGLTTHHPSMSSTPTRDQVENSAFDPLRQYSRVTPPRPSTSSTLSRDQVGKSSFDPLRQYSRVTPSCSSTPSSLSRDQVGKSSFGQVFKYLESIKNDITIMKANQDKMNKKLDKLLMNRDKQRLKFYNLPENLILPVTTDNELISLNTKIKDDKQFQSTLINHFHLYFDGKTMSSFMLNVSKKVMLKEVAMLYSRLGRKGKKCFEELSELYNVILAATSLKFPNTPREELAEKFGRVLAHAPDWDGREQKEQITFANSPEFTD